MFTTNKIFLDSSLLIEAIKGTKTALLERLINDAQNICFINSIVVSEFMFHFLAVNENVSPLTLKMQSRIPEIIRGNNAHDILQHFQFISGDSDLVRLTPFYMEKYNLLPNDAIILATCKQARINRLASYDSELRLPCENERIEFIAE